ncbi:universal stress protein [Natrinema longum]|uniref:Universal stress protein n=1 Tax=Natrinema longum TaxID=370324 RepID=A0A8A2U811_9EURY|nr:universal stress protein [Natrinema longum]MBZ6494148.1 universal stress protein [Natrinema longum]QSW84522.1 universal stress protein [Natrinema longum]
MTHVLVPLAILEGESISAGLTTLLEPMDVTVLGYHVLPEQTPPDQARLQYEEQATDALTDLVAEFEAAGGRADHRLVFTHDREQTIDRIASETGADAYAITGVTGPIERLLVTVTGTVAVERICAFVAELVDERGIDITLFLATDDGTGGRESLESAATLLSEHGIDVETELAVDEPPVEGLIDAAAGHDAVVMGERAPSLRSFLFGEEAERVAAESVGPVLVVRNPEEPDDASR